MSGGTTGLEMLQRALANMPVLMLTSEGHYPHTLTPNFVTARMPAPG